VPERGWGAVEAKKKEGKKKRANKGRRKN